MIVAENKQTEEKVLKAKSGWGMLILSLLLIVAGILLCVFSSQTESALVIVMVCAGVLVIVAGAIMLGGLKTVNPNEAVVLTLFGKYHGTIKKDGFFWVNPFCSAFNPASGLIAGTGRKNRYTYR